jgi:hypothetical protein
MAKTERKKQYDVGFEDAIHQVLMLLAIETETYPRSPSAGMINRVMEKETAGQIQDLLRKYAERVELEIAKMSHEHVTA